MIMIFSGILLLLVAVYPITMWFNKASVVEVAPEEMAGLSVDVEIGMGGGVVYDSQMARDAARRIGNRDIDTELLIPARYNLATFGEQDFNILARAPWGLLTTVARNADDAPVVKFIFNNPVIINTFLARTDVDTLVKNPHSALALVKDEYKINTFFNYDAVKIALSKPEVVAAISSSRLMTAILQGPSAQYFIKNPKTSAGFIKASPTLSALKQNAALVNAIKTNPYTAAAAPVLLQ